MLEMYLLAAVGVWKIPQDQGPIDSHMYESLLYIIIDLTYQFVFLGRSGAPRSRYDL